MYWKLSQRSFFGRIEDTIICFRDCLTFRYFVLLVLKCKQYVNLWKLVCINLCTFFFFSNVIFLFICNFFFRFFFILFFCFLFLFLLFLVFLHLKSINKQNWKKYKDIFKKLFWLWIFFLPQQEQNGCGSDRHCKSSPAFQHIKRQSVRTKSKDQHLNHEVHELEKQVWNWKQDTIRIQDWISFSNVLEYITRKNVRYGLCIKYVTSLQKRIDWFILKPNSSGNCHFRR